MNTTTPGTLYLCATPIGNLEDITFRVLKTLKKVDLIAAEDTRNTLKLLNHFEIKTPMTSYHEYNKIEKAKYLVEKILHSLQMPEHRVYPTPEKNSSNRHMKPA